MNNKILKPANWLKLRAKRGLAKPELLAPVGDFATLIAAIDAGADAVYFGIKKLNMRGSAKNFDLKELVKIVRYAHKNSVKAYLTLNTIVYENEINDVKKIIKSAKRAEIDGIICWDMAVLSLCHDFKIPIILSTQASISNSLSAKFFKKFGVKRIILARECTLEDLKSIKKRANICIEVFVHGAMCQSISGRCFISHSVFGKSANRGDCLQPCRREYLIIDKEDGHYYVLGENYVMSPKDLCTLPFIDKILSIGVGALKIEGRARSPEYVKVVVSVYRKAIDLWFEGKLTDKIKKELFEELLSVYNRGFHSGFYLGRNIEDWVCDSYGSKAYYHKEFMGLVNSFYKKSNSADISIRSGEVFKGDRVLFIGPKTGCFFNNIMRIEKNGNQVDRAVKGDRVIIFLKEPCALNKDDQVYFWRKS